MNIKTVLILHAMAMVMLFACILSLANQISSLAQRNLELASQVAQEKANLDSIIETLQLNSKTWHEQHGFNQAANLRLMKVEAR